MEVDVSRGPAHQGRRKQGIEQPVIPNTVERQAQHSLASKQGTPLCRRVRRIRSPAFDKISYRVTDGQAMPQGGMNATGDNAVNGVESSVMATRMVPKPTADVAEAIGLN